MSTTIYEKSSKDADIEITRLQDRLMAEVVNNLYPQTAIEDNAAVQKMREILEQHGFKMAARFGENTIYPSVRSSYTLVNFLPALVDTEALIATLSEVI